MAKLETGEGSYAFPGEIEVVKSGLEWDGWGSSYTGWRNEEGKLQNDLTIIALYKSGG